MHTICIVDTLGRKTLIVWRRLSVVSAYYSKNETPTLWITIYEKGRRIDWIYYSYIGSSGLSFLEPCFFIVPSIEVHIVTWRQKAGLVSRIDAATAMEQGRKHVSTAKNKHITMEEPLNAVFSIWSMSRLYSENHWEKLSSHDLGVGVGSNQSESLSHIVRRR